MAARSDAQMLDILARYAEGDLLREIGDSHGMSDDAVQQLVARVREADIKHDHRAAAWWQQIARRRANG